MTCLLTGLPSFASLLFAVLLHPVHETVTEVEWNAGTQRLEVAIRLHALDEQWIRRQCDREAEIGAVALEYVRRKVRLNVDDESSETPAEPESDPDRYRWVGRQEEGAHVWWYLEIAPNDRQPPRNIRHRMLFEHETNYANRVVLLGRLPKLATTLTIARPVMDLSTEANLEANPDDKPDGGSDLDRR